MNAASAVALSGENSSSVCIRAHQSLFGHKTPPFKAYHRWMQLKQCTGLSWRIELFKNKALPRQPKDRAMVTRSVNG